MQISSGLSHAEGIQGSLLSTDPFLTGSDVTVSYCSLMSLSHDSCVPRYAALGRLSDFQPSVPPLWTVTGVSVPGRVPQCTWRHLLLACEFWNPLLQSGGLWKKKSLAQHEHNTGSV